MYGISMIWLLIRVYDTAKYTVLGNKKVAITM